MKFTEPKKGWHPLHCYLCGKKYGKVIHFGGKRRLKKCKYCQSIPHYCLDCFKK